ncbi:C3a anaphylatoxin chemotactic receptor-like [Dendropsophus ebraccatus]|uniref:C3a anaphylatoxin chemotactic receptor-like n=1 Tax=Dendropsophus ebraccatus TaxID=150705 RepID=UPI003831F9B8
MDPDDWNLKLSDITLDYNQSFYKNYETSNTTDYSGYGLADIFRKSTVIFYCITFVFGIIGNGLVIWIAGFRMKKTVSAVWFLNLAVADFLCCASLPLRIAEWIHRYTFQQIISCILNIILFNLNMSASVLLLTAMSIDRCVSVMWPFWAKVHRTHKLVRITAAIIWLLSFFLSGFIFYFYGFHFGDLHEWCLFSFFITSYNHFYTIKQTLQLIRLLIMFLIPFLIILISYVPIFFKLKTSKRPQRSQRPYRIITAVILCFFICWCPYYIWPLTPMYDEDSIQSYVLHVIVINLAFLNSCINPIIYVLMGQDIKHGFCRSILSRLEKALTEPPDDPCRGPQDVQHTHNTDV